jgi:hypothetical protein
MRIWVKNTKLFSMEGLTLFSWKFWHNWLIKWLIMMEMWIQGTQKSLFHCALSIMNQHRLLSMPTRLYSELTALQYKV